MDITISDSAEFDCEKLQSALRIPREDTTQIINMKTEFLTQEDMPLLTHFFNDPCHKNAKEDMPVLGTIEELVNTEDKVEVVEHPLDFEANKLCDISDESASSSITSVPYYMNSNEILDLDYANTTLENNPRNNQKVICHICGLVLSRIDKLPLHIQNAHDASKVYKCPDCEHVTNRKLDLKHHIKTNHLFSSELLSCRESDFETDDIWSNSHRKVLKYACDMCGYETTNKNSFRLHMKDIHNRIEDKIFQCDKCFFETRWQSHLWLHRKNKHSTSHEIVYHNCEQCLFKTKWRSHLYKHVKDKHSKNKIVEFYDCQHCIFRTKHQSALYKHRKDKHPEIIYSRRLPIRRNIKQEENIAECSQKIKDIKNLIEEVNDHVRETRLNSQKEHVDDIEPIIEKDDRHTKLRRKTQSKNLTSEMKKEDNIAKETASFTNVFQSFVYNSGKDEDGKGRQLENEKQTHHQKEKVNTNKEEKLNTSRRKLQEKMMNKKETAKNKQLKHQEKETKLSKKEENNPQQQIVTRLKSKRSFISDDNEPNSKRIKNDSKNLETKQSIVKNQKDKHSKNKIVEFYDCQHCIFRTKHQSALYKHRKDKHPEIIYSRRLPIRRNIKQEENIAECSQKIKDIKNLIEEVNDHVRETRQKGHVDDIEAIIKKDDRHTKPRRKTQSKNLTSEIKKENNIAKETASFTNVFQSFVYNSGKYEDGKERQLENEKQTHHQKEKVNTNKEEKLNTSNRKLQEKMMNKKETGKNKQLKHQEKETKLPKKEENYPRKQIVTRLKSKRSFISDDNEPNNSKRNKNDSKNFETKQSIVKNKKETYNKRHVSDWKTCYIERDKQLVVKVIDLNHELGTRSERRVPKKKQTEIKHERRETRNVQR